MSEKEKIGLSLHDIADFGEEVALGDGRTIRAKGISAKGILTLLTRFPDMQKWLAGKDLQMGDVLFQAPDTIAAVIAAGTGSPGDVDAEDLAMSLPAEVQLDLIDAIMRQTFRSGFRPFVQRVLALYNGAVAGFGADPATKSPQASKPSSPTVTTPSESGTTVPAK